MSEISSTQLPNNTDEFSNQKNSKVLAQSTPSEIQGAGLGPVENGRMSVTSTYNDEAGRQWTTTSNHVFDQKADAKIINVPDSVNAASVPNVAARFVR